MIYVTHDQVEAMTMGDRVCIMSHGEVAQVGRPMDVYLNPASVFVASFLGNPRMNLIDAVATEAGIDTGSGRLARRGFAPGSRITFGIRPEDLFAVEDAAGAVLSGRVTQLEALGAETLVHLDTGAPSPVIMRGGRDAPARVGDLVRLGCDAGMARFFDVETGLACEPGDPQ